MAPYISCSGISSGYCEVLCKRLRLIWALLRCYILHTWHLLQGATVHVVEGVQGVQGIPFFPGMSVTFGACVALP